jgi:hypothetical protein
MAVSGTHAVDHSIRLPLGQRWILPQCRLGALDRLVVSLALGTKETIVTIGRW